MPVDPRRIFPLNNQAAQPGPVIYWMSRDQRADDNWALLYAQELALERQAPLAVVFTLAPAFLGATLRQYAFMLKGLSETAQRLNQLNIPFFILRGDPVQILGEFVCQNRAGTVVTDFDPLRIKRNWRERAARESAAHFLEVDAHNIVPCRLASQKQEFGAYTLRPKIHRLLSQFLSDFPPLTPHPFGWPTAPVLFNSDSILAALEIDRSVTEVANISAGATAARNKLDLFAANGLERYDALRNDPCADGQSGLSPWLHFGQLSAQRVALEIGRQLSSSTSVDVYLEELVVRRELADNFCFYNMNYDSVEGFPNWALKTINEHRHDHREYMYSREQFEQAATHDPLWNAAQCSMVVEGTMHGYLRMYWAKKILEWSASPEQAMEIAIYLNDRYQLDGRDPNGYAGIAWSIGGVHDRAWGERPVFGKIRYMNDKGCRRKFDVTNYIRRWHRSADQNVT